MGSRVDYDAPGHSSTTMAYSADGTRSIYEICTFIQKKKKLLSYDDVTEIALHYLWATHRLFSCGTNKEGESFLVEWNESEGAVKRTYHGLGKRTVGIVQFDTTRNRFLAAGDDFLVKFWDMDNTQLLATTDVENSLPVIMVMLGLVLISL